MITEFQMLQNTVKMLNSLQSTTPKMASHPGKFKLGQVNKFLNR